MSGPISPFFPNQIENETRSPSEHLLQKAHTSSSAFRYQLLSSALHSSSTCLSSIIIITVCVCITMHKSSFPSRWVMAVGGTEPAHRAEWAGREGLPCSWDERNPCGGRGSPHASRGDGVFLTHPCEHLTPERHAQTHSPRICKIQGTKARAGEIIYYSLTVSLILNSFCQITSRRIPSSFQYLKFLLHSSLYTLP